jgi:hypothetical protein
MEDSDDIFIDYLPVGACMDKAWKEQASCIVVDGQYMATVIVIVLR